jgi:hypothetical protein
MMSEAMTALCEEIRAEAQSEIERLERLPFPIGCYWADGSLMVPYWRQYWERAAIEAVRVAPELLEPVTKTPVTLTPVTEKPAAVTVSSRPDAPMEELTLFFES